jgi:hypothetical protein
MVEYEGTGDTSQAVWEPVDPEKAIAGMPALTAAVAAPTVPETQTTAPRLEPTLGPVTARSGALPKIAGPVVEIP